MQTQTMNQEVSTTVLPQVDSTNFDESVNALVTGEIGSIDWLTITVKDRGRRELVYNEAGRLFEMGKAHGDVQRPWKFKGFEGYSCGSVRYGDREDCSILMLSGDAAQLNYQPALAWAENISRIDLALTVSLKSAWPGLPKRAYDFIHLQGRKPCKFTRGYQFVCNTAGGQTLYVGSRASDQFGRFYDKGREDEETPLMPPGMVYRYEVEFKSYRAKRVGIQLLAEAKRSEDHPATMIATTIDKWFLSRGVRCISSANMDDVAFALDVSAHISDDQTSLNWLSTQVSPTVKRLCRNGKRDETLRALGLLAD